MITFTIEADYMKDHSPKGSLPFMFPCSIYRNPTWVELPFHKGGTTLSPR